MKMPFSHNPSVKLKGAATAAFLLLLLLAVLPFFFSGFASTSNSIQVFTGAPTENNTVNTDSREYSEATASTQSLPADTDPTNAIQTQIGVNLQPNPVAVLETVSIRIAVLPSPPTQNDRFSNLTLFISRPDGTAEILGPFQSDLNGSLSLKYAPEMIGTYGIQTSYGGQIFADSRVTYRAAESPKSTLTVSPSVTPSPPENTQKLGWQASSTIVTNLPPLGIIGEYSQCLVSTLKGNNRWDLIIGPFNGWTENEYPFMGFHWDGNQWINDNTTVKGLIASRGLNDPTIGFNITGDNRFDMIVGGNPAMSSLGWSGYSWNGDSWVPNPTLLNGLPNYVTGNNFVTLSYNLLGDGKWDLIVDNSGNHGYLGYEWNGISWTRNDILVAGLPNEEAVGPSHKFPAPYLVSNFEGKTILFVGLTGGGGPNGSIEAFEWNGTEWVADELLTYGVSGLLPWPNTPTLAFNVTGNNQWMLLIGSASGFVNQTDYYRGYLWTGRSPVTISPLSTKLSAGHSATLTATTAEGAPPFTYQWYVNDHLASSVASASNVNSWSFTPTSNMTSYVFVKVTDANGLSVDSLKTEVFVLAEGVTLPTAPSGKNSTVPVLFVSCQRNPSDTNFTVEIKGNLTDGGIGLPREAILFSYSIDSGNSWSQLASSNTDNLGNFAILWATPEEGNCLLKAEYSGNSWYTSTSTIVDFETNRVAPSSGYGVVLAVGTSSLIFRGKRAKNSPRD